MYFFGNGCRWYCNCKLIGWWWWVWFLDYLVCNWLFGWWRLGLGWFGWLVGNYYLGVVSRCCWFWICESVRLFVGWCWVFVCVVGWWLVFGWGYVWFLVVVWCFCVWWCFGLRWLVLGGWNGCCVVVGFWLEKFGWLYCGFSIWNLVCG